MLIILIDKCLENTNLIIGEPVTRLLVIFCFTVKICYKTFWYFEAWKVYIWIKDSYILISGIMHIILYGIRCLTIEVILVVTQIHLPYKILIFFLPILRQCMWCLFWLFGSVKCRGSLSYIHFIRFRFNTESL